MLKMFHHLFSSSIIGRMFFRIRNGSHTRLYNTGIIILLILCIIRYNNNILCILVNNLHIHNMRQLLFF